VGIGYFKKKLIISCIDTLLVLTREEKAMQEYANEYTPDFQEAMDDLAEYRESKNMLNRMPYCVTTYDSGTKEQLELKNHHGENCTCSYCDPSAPIFTDQTKERDSMTVGGEDGLLEHGENCACQYCRGYDGLVGALGNVQPETIELTQFSSKEEERAYIEEQLMTTPPLKDEPPTDTKSFRDMFSVWKRNLAGELEKEYTVASKKDLAELAKEDIRTARLIKDIDESKAQSVIHSHSNNGAPFCESDCCGPGHISHGIMGDFFEDKSVQNSVYLKNKAAAKKKIIGPCLSFTGQTEEAWKSQLKQVDSNGRIPWSQPKTKLVIVYVGKSSKSKWDKIINEYKPVFTEVQEAMPQCMVIYVPDVGAQEGQIRVETHDLS